MNVSSIAGFRSQNKAQFSAVVRTLSGAQQFASDSVLIERHPGLYRVAKATLRQPPSSSGSNPPMPVLLRSNVGVKAHREELTTEDKNDRMVFWFMAALALAFVLMLFTGNVHAQTYPTSWGGSTYEPRSEARRVTQVRYATVLDVRMVALREESTNYAASAVGGGLGGLLGSQVGKGNGQTAAQILLAAAGAYTANRLANRTREGMEVIVKMDDGRLLSIVQERDGLQFGNGDRVRIVGSDYGNATRVVPAPEAPAAPKDEKKEQAASEMWLPSAARIASR